jgi:hypothetical protein
VVWCVASGDLDSFIVPGGSSALVIWNHPIQAFVAATRNASTSAPAPPPGPAPVLVLSGAELQAPFAALRRQLRLLFGLTEPKLSSNTTHSVAFRAAPEGVTGL